MSMGGFWEGERGGKGGGEGWGYYRGILYMIGVGRGGFPPPFIHQVSPRGTFLFASVYLIKIRKCFYFRESKLFIYHRYLKILSPKIPPLYYDLPPLSSSSSPKSLPFISSYLSSQPRLYLPTYPHTLPPLPTSLTLPTSPHYLVVCGRILDFSAFISFVDDERKEGEDILQF